MTAVESALRRIVADLVRSRQLFALVGGFAVSARTEPRFTRHVDLVVAVADDEDAERVLRDLVRRRYVVVATAEHLTTQRLATARLASPVAPGRELIVDLLFASSGAEHEIATAAEPLELLDGLVVPVATLGDLIALKLLSRDDDARPQDAADLVRLRAAATAEDLEVARATLASISARGYARGRDLEHAFELLTTDR